jgi:hypothetical protein
VTKKFCPLLHRSKLNSRTCHEGIDGEQTYNSTLFLTSPLDEVVRKRHAPAALPPEKGPCSHCTRGRVSPRGGLDDYQRHHSPGFDHRTIHPLASRYTDCAIPAHHPYIVVSSGLNTKHHLLRRPQKECLLSYWSGTI